MQHSLLTQLMNLYGFGGHSIYAPSSSAMWLFCPGSLIPNKMAPDESSFEAAEGTVAHTLHEEWLKTGKKPKHRLGEEVWHRESDGEVYQILIDNVMMDHVQDSVDWCRFEEGDHFVEQKVYFTELMPTANPDEEGAKPIPFVAQGGTADHVVCRRHHMTITDFKYGKGIQIFAENNTQAQLYALGFFFQWDWLYDFQTISIRIAQPRFDHFDTWEITRAQLLKFAEFVRVRAKEAWMLDAPRRASEKACRWCRVKSSCAALAKLNESLVMADFDSMAEQDSESMADLKERLDHQYKMQLAKHAQLTTAQMAKLLPHRKMIEAWWQALDNELERRALDGEHIPGHKLVEARTNRKFISEKSAVEHLDLLGLNDDDMYELSFITPSQAEELLRKRGKIPRSEVPGLLRGQIFKPPGRPTLVPLIDKRPSLEDKYADVWDD